MSFRVIAPQNSPFSALCFNCVAISYINELIYIFKKKSIKKLTQKDIEKYFKYLKVTKSNSNATINCKLAFLGKGLEYYNNNLKLPYQKVINKPKNIITYTQFNYLVDSYNQNKQMLQYLYLAYYTGLRVNEILNIRTGHFKKEENIYYLNLYNTKNHSDNFIPLTNKLNDIVNSFEEFTLNYKQVHYLLSLHKVTSHQFRHTFITRCYEKGLDCMVIMKLSNHKSLSVHQRYNHISNKRLKDIVQVL